MPTNQSITISDGADHEGRAKVDSGYTTRVAVAGLLGLLVVLNASVGQAQDRFGVSGSLAAPRTFDIELRAGRSSQSGTTGTVYVSLYSQNLGRWSSWVTVEGLRKGRSKVVSLQEEAAFTGVSEARVWIGADGAHVSVVVRHGHEESPMLPAYRWVKNRSERFEGPPIAHSSDQEPVYTCSRRYCYCHDEHVLNSFDCWSMWLTECRGVPKPIPGYGGVARCEREDY